MDSSAGPPTRRHGRGRMTPEGPPVVIKVGGSLLDLPALPSRLLAYLAGRSGERQVLVVGGGGAADWVRDLDRVHGLGEETAHALAMRALDLTAYALAAAVPGLDVVDHPRDLGACWAAGRTPIFCPRRLLDEDDRVAPDPLPHSWDVTSDSIAARVARCLRARELVLLKSVSLPTGVDLAEAARLGLVDPAFPAVVSGLVVTLVNLRAGSDPGRD